MYVKTVGHTSTSHSLVSNSAEPDQTPPNAASDQVVHCFVSQRNFKTFLPWECFFRIRTTPIISLPRMKTRNDITVFFNLNISILIILKTNRDSIDLSC